MRTWLDTTADCTVKAVARIARVDYLTANRIALRRGYQPGKGMTIAQTLAAAWDLTNAKPRIYGPAALPFKTVAEAEAYPGRGIVWVDTPEALHVMALEDGRVYNRQGTQDAARILGFAEWEAI
jgi:hypothetical protein